MGIHTFGTLVLWIVSRRAYAVPCGSVQGLTFDLTYLTRGYMGVRPSIQHKARLSLEAVAIYSCKKRTWFQQHRWLAEHRTGSTYCNEKR